MRDPIGKFGLILLIVGVVNFIVFVTVALIIGGDAWSGEIKDGHFFVSDHGGLTEVSRNVFYYSKVHAISTMVTHPLAAFGGLLWGRERIAKQINRSASNRKK